MWPISEILDNFRVEVLLLKHCIQELYIHQQQFESMEEISVQVE